MPEEKKDTGTSIEDAKGTSTITVPTIESLTTELADKSDRLQKYFNANTNLKTEQTKKNEDMKKLKDELAGYRTKKKEDLEQAGDLDALKATHTQELSEMQAKLDTATLEFSTLQAEKDTELKLETIQTYIENSKKIDLGKITISDVMKLMDAKSIEVNGSMQTDLCIAIDPHIDTFLQTREHLKMTEDGTPTHMPAKTGPGDGIFNLAEADILSKRLHITKEGAANVLKEKGARERYITQGVFPPDAKRSYFKKR